MSHRLAGAFALVLALVSPSRAAQEWDLATDFPNVLNPNGAWTYGFVTGGHFGTMSSHVQDSVLGPLWSGPSGELVWKNPTALTRFGIAPGLVSLGSDNGVPDVRWTAPYSGQFTFTVAVGGSTTSQNGGYGNSNASLANLALDNASISSDSFVANVKTWTLTNQTLKQGDVIDLSVAQRYGGGNTQTSIHVAAVPEPASFLPLGLGVLALVRRRALSKTTVRPTPSRRNP